MEVKGIVKAIGFTQDVSSSFRKREIVVMTDEQYPQPIQIDFNQDKVSLLDSVQVGDYVTVSINLKGREWTSPQGETRFFNTIVGWRIVGSQQQDVVQQQQQGGNYYGSGSAVDAYKKQNNM